MSWRDTPAAIAEEEIVSREEADVVVVGLGYAGTACVRAAAEGGLSVIGIEQQKQERFITWGHDIGHINSAFLKRRGVPKVDVLDYFNEWMRRAGNRANPSLIMKFVRNSGAAFDWFTDMVDVDSDGLRVAFWPAGRKFDGELGGYRFWTGTAQFRGMPFKMPPMKADDDTATPDQMMAAQEGGSILEFNPQNLHLPGVVRANLRKACERGATLHFATDAVQCVKNAEGRVVGLIGRDEEGCHYYGARRAVVIAAGDFGGNAEMVRELAPDCDALRVSDKERSGGGRKGRGIQLGVWAGGRVEAGALPTMGGNFTTLRGFNCTFGSLFLNTEGRRYCNEVFGDPVMAGFPANQMKRGTYYSIFDSDVLAEDLAWAVPAHEGYDHEYDGMLTDAMAKAREAGPGGVRLRALGGPVLISAGNDMDELLDNAGLTGALREAVRGSIERYNELCRGGRDEDFGKDVKVLRPLDKWPLYIQQISTKSLSPMLCAVGGLLTDECQNVLDQGFDPIAGLYATGNSCGRRFGAQYSTPTSGISIGIALTLGKVLGDELAAGR